ncbi:alpha/beta hydrolase [Nonomuraea sp. FMUSA5-5]|uniref:Alpha/beta hydrolase n=1 Tax=Nonomuraea composti TaxID=2720023 RepID=A0ABX1B5B8_9ACTN|nr:alpha/beta hydrolase [Nonomuraea sp. FMUSA5-5]NJP90919.1 alpha/beta hydrolase [Nonomuraea sp. FMUSA5-5]
MTRAYDEETLRRLLDGAEHATVNGATVLLKRATPDDRPGHLDPWLLSREEVLRRLPSAVPKPSLRLLWSMLFRPEKLLIQIRDTAKGIVLSPEAESAIDLTTEEVLVSRQELVLWKNTNTLWRYERKSTSQARRPCLLHLHGGGFFAGKPTGRDYFLKYIAEQADAVVFDLDYSLSPEYRFPHAVNETYAAVKHIHDHADEYGIDPARIAIGGGSAGGNLAAVTALKAKDEGTPIIALQILMNAVVMMGTSRPPGYTWNPADFHVADGMRKHAGRIVDPARDRNLKVMLDPYRGGQSTGHPYLSPAMAGDLTGLPRALVITAEMDSLRPQAEHYAGQLVQAGVPVKAVRYLGIKHDTPAHFGYVPQAEAIAWEIITAIKKETW